MTKKKSSWINAVNVKTKGTIDIELHSGKCYRYFGVPDNIYTQIKQADSFGTFFNQYIRGAGYEYELLT